MLVKVVGVVLRVYCPSPGLLIKQEIVLMQCIGPSAVNYPPPKDKAPDAVFVDQTSEETSLLYR